MKHLIKSSLATALIGGAAFCALSACANNKSEQADSQATEEATQEAAAIATEDAATTDDVFAQSAGVNKEEIQTLPSGLKYVVKKEGDGANPTATDVVEVYYTGKLTDGTIFDSTDLHGGEPLKFPLNQVIPGWTEGIQLMKEGGEYVFYIPSDLAYGERGVPGAIPGGAPLIFEVQLLKVVK